MTQPDLWEALTVPIIPVSPARKTDPITSFIAANGNVEGKAKDRVKALLALDAAGDKGLTDFELAEVTGSQQTSIGKRRGELTGKVKGKQVDPAYVEDSGMKRPAPSGSPSIVWKITRRGHEIAQLIRERMSH